MKSSQKRLTVIALQKRIVIPLCIVAKGRLGRRTHRYGCFRNAQHSRDPGKRRSGQIWLAVEQRRTESADSDAERAVEDSNIIK